MARITPTGKGGSLLDNGVAALAALSSGFLAYAMPEGLFSRIVVASRLPQFLAAAQPPLGMKARLAVIAIVVLVAYAFVWSLMRALDSIGRKPRPAAAVEEEAPRLRRADAHPDAPSRRPIFAGRDLGEPEMDEEPLELHAEAAIEPEAETPVEPHFEAEPEVAFEAEPEPQPEPEAGSAPLPRFLVPQQPEPEAWHAPEAPAVHDEEPIAFTRAPEARPAEAPAAWHHEAPADDIDDEYDEEEEGEDEAPEADAEGDDQSLSRLMKRFESGLTRKQQALSVPPPAPVAEPEPMPVPQERVGHRLRSAISDLGKISAPGR